MTKYFLGCPLHLICLNLQFILRVHNSKFCEVFISRSECMNLFRKYTCSSVRLVKKCTKFLLRKAGHYLELEVCIRPLLKAKWLYLRWEGVKKNRLLRLPLPPPAYPKTLSFMYYLYNFWTIF